MALEWDKIKSAPTKGYKVLGQNLLDLKEKLEILEKNNSELTNTRNELKTKINSLEKKITNLESEIKGKDEKITSLEDNINELKKQQEKELETKNRKISELENSISNKEEEIKRINEDISEKNNKISELENQISVKESEIENLKKNQAEKASQDENEIKSLKSQLDKLQREVKPKEDALREKDREIDELNKKIEELNTEIEKLKKQVPKERVFEKAEEVIKGGSCPKCGFSIYEEYKTVEGKRQLIRKYCPSPSCGWTIIGMPEIAIAVEAEVPEEAKKELKIFKVKLDGIEEATALDSKMVAIISDPAQNIIWIWKGKDSNRFEYAEATGQTTKVKNEIIKMPHARIERVDEGKEPEIFPKLKR